MKVAIYARVSTQDQDCRSQLAELRQYCAVRSWTIDEEFIDQAVSGARTHRPALGLLMTGALKRRFDAILVVKLDRFGRSVHHLALMLKQLESAGVRFVAISQGIDTDRSNPAANFLLHILAAVAEFERELIRERVKSGMEFARQQGISVGRPVKVFRRDLAREMRANGSSWKELAHEFGVSIRTVRRAVVQPLAKGVEG